jgi:hypothetical protein
VAEQAAGVEVASVVEVEAAVVVVGVVVVVGPDSGPGRCFVDPWRGFWSTDKKHYVSIKMIVLTRTIFSLKNSEKN